ncbi:advanced glycosylation end product-specific receptor isoform X1 [Sarcophilus harrisii]|uniref:advanced glycosylation end product-specific receptor isoform X1 n=1 Tax=Sarcophilus harrisii TaxID=9305 RepID=UPI001301BFAC|nr:advanced glycosylation end product-specific receptor isoform X1 [Sarcophilus harrisii]
MAFQTNTGAWVLILSLGVVGSQNISARIGEPLVLTCKGAPRKPPQQLEWKLNTGRTEAWKILSPGENPWESVARVLPNGSLLLPAVGIQDEGTFRCKATNRHGKEFKSNYRLRVYQIPSKPKIVNSASELIAGIPNKVELKRKKGGGEWCMMGGKGIPKAKVEGDEVFLVYQVGTCLSEGGYPAGTLSWHLDGKALVPDGKGVSVREETRRHPDTGLFTIQSELTMTPVPGGPLNPTFSCSLSFSPSSPGQQALHAPPIQLSVWEPESLEEVRLVVDPEGGVVAPGGAVTLTCEVPAQHSPQIHWLKDGSPLAIAPSSVLLLPEITVQDQGIYSCVATDQSHRSRESPGVSISIIDSREIDQVEGSEGGPGLGLLALILIVLGGLVTAALLGGFLLWKRQRLLHKEERKVPECPEEEEERAELNQPEKEETAENNEGEP